MSGFITREEMTESERRTYPIQAEFEDSLDKLQHEIPSYLTFSMEEINNAAFHYIGENEHDGDMTTEQVKSCADYLIDFLYFLWVSKETANAE